MTRIDLNADLGEGGADDLHILPVISSCNIACGGHTGDAASMTATVCAAIANGVAIGAHPSYPDRDGFGRRSHFVTGTDLQQSIIEQIAALQRIVATSGGKLVQVKPHGALYHDAARDDKLAGLVVGAMQLACPQAALLGPPQSAMQRAASRAGAVYFAEAFVDRCYSADGTLVPRAAPNAVHGSIHTITAQAISLAQKGEVTADNGDVIRVRADTLCIHGDTEHAGVIARAVRDALEASGIEIRALH